MPIGHHRRASLAVGVICVLGSFLHKAYCCVVLFPARALVLAARPLSMVPPFAAAAAPGACARGVVGHCLLKQTTLRCTVLTSSCRHYAPPPLQGKSMHRGLCLQVLCECRALDIYATP